MVRRQRGKTCVLRPELLDLGAVVRRQRGETCVLRPELLDLGDVARARGLERREATGGGVVGDLEEDLLLVGACQALLELGRSEAQRLDLLVARGGRARGLTRQRGETCVLRPELFDLNIGVEGNVKAGLDVVVVVLVSSMYGP